MAKKGILDTGVLGKIYKDGQVIVCQGEVGDCMYVIQEGQVEVVANEGDDEIRLAVLGEREFFGEMALFESEVRTATVRALGPVRVLTVDRKTFLRRIHKDPSLAYHIVQTMSQRIRELDAEVTRLRAHRQTSTADS